MDTITPKRINWFRRHIFLTIAIALLAGLGVFYATGGQRYIGSKIAIMTQSRSQTGGTNAPLNSSGDGSSSTNNGAKSGTFTTPESTLANGVHTKMTLSGSHAILQPGGGAQVTGQIINNQNSTKSVNIQATFYDKSGGTVGIARGNVTNLDPDQTKPFTLTTIQNVASYEKMVVQTSSIY